MQGSLPLVLGAPAALRVGHSGRAWARPVERGGAGGPAVASLAPWAVAAVVAGSSAVRAGVRGIGEAASRVALRRGGRRQAGRERVAVAVAPLGRERAAGNPYYVRVLCGSVQWVGECGAIVGLRQFNDVDAPYHTLEVPFELPFLLDAQEADAFQFATHGVPSFLEEIDTPLDTLSISEICVQTDDGTGNKGLLTLAEERRPAEGRPYEGSRHQWEVGVMERRISVPVGEALAVATRFSLPLLLDARAAVRAGIAAVDRMRLERLMCVAEGDPAGGDLELVLLRERLSAGLAKEVSTAWVGSLIEELKPFAWYWAENLHADRATRRTPPRQLQHYREQYLRLRERQREVGATDSSA